MGKQILSGGSELRLWTFENRGPNTSFWLKRAQEDWQDYLVSRSSSIDHGPEIKQVTNPPVNGQAAVDMTDWVTNWASAAWSNYGMVINTSGYNAYFRIGAAEEKYNNGSVGYPMLLVNYNTPPPVPHLVGPQTTWIGTSAPTLAAYYSDPDLNSGNLDFEIAGVVFQPVPASNNMIVRYTPVVGPGTYSWRARIWDGFTASGWSEWRTFTITSDTGIRQADTYAGSDGAPWNSNIWTADPPYGYAPQPPSCPTDGVPHADLCGNQGRMYVSNGQVRIAATGMQAVSDTEVVFTYRFSDRGARSRLRVDLRGDGSFSPASGYRFEVQSDGSTIRLKRLSGGSSTTVDEYTYTKDTNPQRVRFSAEGGVVRVKVWPAAEGEPDGEGELEWTDPTPLPAGVLEFQHDWTSGSRAVFVDDLSLYDLSATNPLNDSAYMPAAAYSNGIKIFLSPANHKGGNIGCDNFLEDAWAHDIAGDQRDPSRSYRRVKEILEDWGYTVFVGNGTSTDKKNHSNSVSPHAHIPIHSNSGRGALDCGQAAYDKLPTNLYGTRVMYEKSAQLPFAQKMFDVLQQRADSPGGEPNGPNGDRVCLPGPPDNCSGYTSLEELRAVTAPVAAYLEVAFHVFQPDKDFIDGQRQAVAEAIAYGIGEWFNDTTGPPACRYPVCPSPD